VNVRHWKINTKRGAQDIAIVHAGKGASLSVIEVTESPTGRSVMVFINGRKIDLEATS
jgi:hypothetical protein